MALPIQTVYTSPAPDGPWNLTPSLGYGQRVDGLDDGKGHLMLPAAGGTGLKYEGRGFPELWTIQVDITPIYITDSADPTEVSRMLKNRLVENIGADASIYDDRLPDLYGVVTCGVGGSHRDIPLYWGRGTTITFLAQTFSLKFYTNQNPGGGGSVLGAAIKGAQIYAWAARGSNVPQGRISGASISCNVNTTSAECAVIPPGASKFSIGTYENTVAGTYRDVFDGKSFLEMRQSRAMGAIRSNIRLTAEMRGAVIPIDPCVRYIGLSNVDTISPANHSVGFYPIFQIGG
jgi:hypothetical protein